MVLTAKVAIENFSGEPSARGEGECSRKGSGRCGSGRCEVPPHAPSWCTDVLPHAQGHAAPAPARGSRPGAAGGRVRVPAAGQGRWGGSSAVQGEKTRPHSLTGLSGTCVFRANKATNKATKTRPQTRPQEFVRNRLMTDVTNHFVCC